MADNTVLNAGTGGDTIASDDIAGIKYQRVKLSLGADGSATDALGGAGAVAAGVARVTLASDDPGVAALQAIETAVEGTLVVDGSGVTQPVSHAALTELAAAISTEVQCDIVGALPAGDNNIGNVDLASAIPAGTNNIGDVDVLTLPSATLAGATKQELDYDTGAGTQNTPLVGIALPASGGPVAGGTSTNPIQVGDAGGSLTVDGTVTANLAAGDNNIGDVDILSIAAGDNNIGNVDIVTMPNVTLAAGTNTNEVVGDVAHDAAAAGNPVGVGGVSIDTDDTAPPNRVSAEADAVRLGMTRDGAIFAYPHGPQVWSYHVNGSSALTDTSVHAAPGAGLSLYVTDIVISLGAATALNVFFEEGASTVLGPYYLEAVNGRSIHLAFKTPKKITANTALTVTSSAAVAHAIDVTGFTAP